MKLDIHIHFANALRVESESPGLPAALVEIRQQINNIMSAIADFAVKVNEHNTKIEAAVDGITADIKVLNDKITELQNSPGTITPEDQALLDSIESQSQTIADKLGALNDLTPPAVPNP